MIYNFTIFSFFLHFFFSDPNGPSTVAPFQGPIFIKNGSVPVVPVLSYPIQNNGSFVQIPVSTKTDFIIRW